MCLLIKFIQQMTYQTFHMKVGDLLIFNLIREKYMLETAPYY